MEKSIVNVQEVKFLGHRLSSAGIHPDPDIVQKILSCKPPKDKADLECFLGLVNFFGRMIPRFSNTSQPLHELRRKDKPFIWEQSHQNAFDSLLKSLSAQPVLKPYDLQQEATLTTDSSSVAIGGVLTQNGAPVIYVSRTLTSAERNYSNIEREGLAVVWCVLRLQQLLLGRKFNLVSDHRPLIKLFGNFALPKIASARITRWAAILQRFDFDITYKPGSSIPTCKCAFSS